MHDLNGIIKNRIKQLKGTCNTKSFHTKLNCTFQMHTKIKENRKINKLLLRNLVSRDDDFVYFSYLVTKIHFGRQIQK